MVSDTKSLELSNLNDPEVFVALKRICAYLVDSAWQTSSTDPEYDFAIAKSKQFQRDVKKLASIDNDIAWGQMKRKTKGGLWISTDEGNFNPWYEGELVLSDLLGSIELLAELIDATTPQYLSEIEFLHHYHFLRSKLPSRLPAPTSISLNNLHPKIQEHSRQRFNNGHYSDAILAAYKVVFNEIKIITGIHDLDGKQLAEKALSLSNPLIRLNDLATQSDKDEQLGFMLLLSGAAVGIRNPKAHDLVVQEDKLKTLRYLAFASLLMERLEERQDT